MRIDDFHFDTIDQLIEFFDTHDMGGYATQMPEAQFEIAATNLLPKGEEQEPCLGAKGAGT